MGKNYNTKQKVNIEEIIAGYAGEHFTAERLMESARENGGCIGVATVYRHLDKMVREGRLRKFSANAGESACYQAAEECGEHFHLKCVGCGQLIHLSCEHLADIGEHILNEHGFSVDMSKTVLLGLCGECRKNAKTGENGEITG